MSIALENVILDSIGRTAPDIAKKFGLMSLVTKEKKEQTQEKLKDILTHCTEKFNSYLGIKEHGTMEVNEVDKRYANAMTNTVNDILNPENESNILKYSLTEQVFIVYQLYENAKASGSNEEFAIDNKHGWK